MFDCGFSPLMSSLSDRNMILGDVLLPPGIDNPSILVVSKVICCVCRSTSSVVTPTCISVSPTGDKPWYLCRGKFAAILHLNLPLGVTNEGREAIKKFMAPL